MNGTTIKEFLVGLGFQVDESSLKKFDSGVKSASLSVAALGTASIAAAGAIVAFVGSVANKLDAVGDAADTIGTTVNELMRFQYAATLSGSSAEMATSAMESLSRISGEAAQGIGRGAKVFADLGLNAKNAAGELKPTTQLLTEVGDKIKDLTRGEQSAILQRLGIDPSMIGALTGGLAELGGEFDNLYEATGVNLNQAAEASGAFNDALDRLSMTFDAVKTSIAIKFMPQIARGIDTVRKFLIQNLPKIIAAIQPVFSIILRIAEAFITLAGRVASGAGIIIGWFTRLNDATNGWAGYIAAAALAWKVLNLSFLKTPIGMLLALAVGVALLIDDFLTFREGGESLIDWGSGFGTVMKVVTAILGGVLGAVVAVKGGMMAWSAATTAFNVVMGLAKGVMAAFNLIMAANPIALVILAIAALIAAGIFLVANWEDVKSWFSSFYDWFSGLFDGIPDMVAQAFSGASDAAINIFNGVKEWFTDFFGWIMSKFDAIKDIAGAVTGFASKATDKVSSVAGDAWASVKGVFGGGDGDVAKTFSSTNPSASLTPSPKDAAAINGGQQNVNQETQIIVQGSGNAEATASAVAGQQNRVNADMARNMRGAAR